MKANKKMAGRRKTGARPAERVALVTGFEPFGGDAENPSQEIARALDGRVVAGWRVAGAVLPCAFGAAFVELERRMRATRPELVICLGLAAGRAEVTPERVAVNLDDARLADNAGAQPVDRPIVRGGPAAYWTTLPAKAIVAALRAREIPAGLSLSAGTFVCNHVFYRLMRTLRRRPGTRGGFIHVPRAAEHARAGEPGLPLATMIAAVEIALEVAAGE